MKRRFFVLAGTTLGVVAALWFARSKDDAPRVDSDTHERATTEARYVSLAPAITETLTRLDAASELVAVSDYCDNPRHLPTVGSAITPRYEEIARARPTRILTTAVGGSQLGPLAQLAPVDDLPWLTTREIVDSLRKLGAITHRETSANVLADRFEKTFVVDAPAGAPRVLALLGYESAGGGTYWFIKDESVHGALVRAAGGKNAITTATPGAPRLGVEDLLKLDPDVIVAFTSDATPNEEASPLVRELNQLAPLRAVREKRVGVLGSKALLDVGPSLLEFVEPLRQKIATLTARKTP